MGRGGQGVGSEGARVLLKTTIYVPTCPLLIHFNVLLSFFLSVANYFCASLSCVE